MSFSRSQSECCTTEGRDQFPHSFSFRNFREKKRNTLHFPDYLVASMTLLPDYVNFMGDNKSLPDQSPHNGYLSDDNSENVADNNLLPLCGADSEDDSFDVLPSPRVSPDMTHIPNVVVISDSETTQGRFDANQEKGRNFQKNAGYSQNTGSTTSRQKNFLSVPKKHLRRVSSGSLTSGSDESEGEPSPPLSRRGRRSAIYDAKNFGDVSPSTLSPELSPSNSCDEGEGGSNLAGRLRRRRSSVDIPMSVYPGDLLGHGVTAHNKKLTKRNTVADFATRQDLPTIYSEAVADSKKGRQTFSLLKLMKTRSKENLTQLEEVLMKLKPSEFRDNTLIGYKNLHWSDLIASPDTKADPLILSCKEMKRREAVWELFKSEVIFLVDHLMVLKHCFMEPLKKVQVEGHLMFAEPRYLFGNLDEICYVSYTFCKDFLSALLKSMSSTEFGTTTVLIKAFQRFSCHSKDGDVYHIYCLNYMNAMSYLEQLRRHEEFCEFEKWCEQDQRCNRLQVPDLLVAPIQHCTKLPLMLSNIRTYTENEEEKQQITESIEKVENSLYELEDKMKWLKNYERVREIHQQLIWPTINEIDPRVFIPDFMKHMLQKQPCEKLLTCPKRQLLHEGQLSLIETTKTLDAYVFLFDDIVIITKYKKAQRKHQRQSTGEISQRQNLASTLDRGTFTVYRQPIALDRLIMHDLTTSEAISCGLKNTFMLLHISRFQQVIGVYTLQPSSEAAKNQWVTSIKEAKEKYAEKHGTYQDNHSDRTTGYIAPRGEYAPLNTTEPPDDGTDDPAPRDLNGSS